MCLTLLGGCVSERTIVKIECPQLEPPPVAVVDVIEDLSATDPNAGHWLIALEKHLQVLDTCAGR